MDPREHSYVHLKRLKEKRGEIEFEAEIPLTVIEDHIHEVLGDLRAKFELPGFRKGQVPEHMLRQHTDESRVFEDAVGSAIRNAAGEIVEDEKLSVIGLPKITVTKFILHQPVLFTLRFALSPAIMLPDYKKIGHAIMARKDETFVNEEEMKEAIDRIRKFAATHGGKDGSAPMPELTDAFAAQIGPFKNVEELKTEVKNELIREKKNRIEQAKREEIVSEIVSNSRIEIPALLIEQELAAWSEERDAELKKSGIPFEKYLKENGKDAQTLESETRALIEKEIATRMILHEIEWKEELAASREEIGAYVAQLKLRYPDRDMDELERVAENIAIREKIFTLLTKTESPESAKESMG